MHQFFHFRTAQIMRTELCKVATLQDKQLIKNLKNSTSKFSQLPIYSNLSYLDNKTVKTEIKIKSVVDNGINPRKTFFVKGQPDQKSGRRLIRTLITITKQFLEKLQIPFQNVKNVLIMISTRAPPYNIVLVDNINPDTGADTSNKIIIEPSIQFARKAPSSLQITLEPPPKTSDTPTSSGNLQRWSRALDDFSKIPRCWATNLLII